MPVIAYLRVSTDKQHIENQKDEIRRFAQARDLEIDRWVTETVSGKTRNRDRKLGPLLRSMQGGDTLIVTEISRLSRTLTDLMSILGRCLEKKIVLYSTKEGYVFDNSINSKVLAFAFGLVAELEHNLMSLRTKEALALRKAEGVHIGRPYGTDVKKRILVDNRHTIADMLRQGRTVSHICRTFNVSRTVYYAFRREYRWTE
ncbi:recombinase family protein [uncultured Rikenella sp.]|uniref:recombinase family protein n=1 Tax=uncultured Rikenella sp. TaxID=368003 RepID=UPI0025E49066|nr:recombinase family protein [uncultured Rikenella sp.]